VITDDQFALRDTRLPVDELFVWLVLENEATRGFIALRIDCLLTYRLQYRTYGIRFAEIRAMPEIAHFGDFCALLDFEVVLDAYSIKSSVVAR